MENFKQSETLIISETLAIQGDIANDATDSGNPVKIGVIADNPTSPTSVSAIGDRTNLKATLQGELFSYNTRLHSGEDQTAQLQGVGLKATSSNTNTTSKDVSSALEASSISKNSAGNFYHAFGVIDATAPTDTYYVQFLDSATLPADGAVTHIISPNVVNHTNGTDTSFETGPYLFGLPAANGVVIVLSTTLVTKTIAGSYLFGTVLFK